MSVGRGRWSALTCSKEYRGLLGRTEPSFMRGGRTMQQYTEAFVGIDTAKKKHALAIADPGRDGETRYLGEIDSAPAAVQRMIQKLARRYEKLYFCYEAGPDGIWSLPPGACFGSRLHRGCALVGAKATGRADQDQPARCRDTGSPVARRGSDAGLGAGRGA